MPSIRRITLFPVRVPIAFEKVNDPEFPETLNRKPNGDWGGQWFGDVPTHVIRIDGDNGGPSGYADTPRVVSAEVLRQLAPRLLGRSIDEIDPRRSLVLESWDAVKPPAGDYNRQSYVATYYKGVDTALLDWAARHRGVPLHKLFGDKVRDRVRCEFWSGYRNPAGAAKVTAKAKELGFLGLKLKAHLGIDVPGVVQAVQDAGGPDFALNIDPNGRWETLENCLERVRAAVKIKPDVQFEDPVYGSYATIAEVRRQTGCRTAITANTPERVQQAMALDAADVFNIGSIWPYVLATAAELQRFNRPFWLGSSLESALSDMASIHMACTQPNCTAGSDLIASFFREDDLVVQGIRYEGGHALVPAAPGLGLDPDWNAIEKYRAGDPVVIE